MSAIVFLHHRWKCFPKGHVIFDGEISAMVLYDDLLQQTGSRQVFFYGGRWIRGSVLWVKVNIKPWRVIHGLVTHFLMLSFNVPLQERFSWRACTINGFFLFYSLWRKTKVQVNSVPLSRMNSSALGWVRSMQNKDCEGIAGDGGETSV